MKLNLTYFCNYLISTHTPERQCFLGWPLVNRIYIDESYTDFAPVFSSENAVAPKKDIPAIIGLNYAFETITILPSGLVQLADGKHFAILQIGRLLMKLTITVKQENVLDLRNTISYDGMRPSLLDNVMFISTLINNNNSNSR